MRFALCVLAMFALFGATSAHAQVCPDGAEGHPLPDERPSANGYCMPLRCLTDADCYGDMHCADGAMCIGAIPTPSGRTTETAWHACEEGDACNADERCVHARFCFRQAPVVRHEPVPPPAPPPSTPPPPAPAHPTASPTPATAPTPVHGNTGCSAAPLSGGSPLVLGVAVALIASLARRRATR